MRLARETAVACVTLTLIVSVAEAGLLYPYASETRDVRSLDGVWNFRLADPSDPQVGHREEWYKQDLRVTGATVPMPVPSSYNDITENKTIRDHVGVVWYDRRFFAPPTWSSAQVKVWLRFGSVHYAADVYVNGQPVMSHSGGHVPFETEVTPLLKFGENNLISVAVDNSLTDVTVPQGKLSHLETDNGPVPVQEYTFDFFNYAGIHRSVLLYTTPIVYINDITVTTGVAGNFGNLNYDVTTEGATTPSISATLLDRDGTEVRKLRASSGGMSFPDPHLWWPYLMHDDPGYLYTLEVTTDVPRDVYRLPVGIRDIQWSKDNVTINGKPLYLRGFGRHEDSDIRGRGHDSALIVRDYNLIKWVGANSFRTSHYPYSEEIMDFADREGIMIVDECPGVNIGGYGFNNELLEAHKTALSQLYLRDKNRPSVIMWSIANEALTGNTGADTYFSSLADHLRSLDNTRPITMAVTVTPESDLACQALDVVSFNRYNAWYVNYGRIDAITENLKSEAERWRKKYNKPVLVTEYGADTIPGLHLSPDYMWSEEYQLNLLSKHFQAFDDLRQENFFIGEMIWNFADFNTAQTITRVGGNRKGIFTRERQPKASAHLTRKRYWALAEELDGARPPGDVNEYISIEKQQRSEL